MKCWEFMKCGREGGGAKAKELGVCPAWPNHGTSCAHLAGTLCGDKVQGNFAQKIDSCESCDFYRITQVSQHSEMLSHMLIEQCPLAIFGVDRQGLITIFNPAAEKLTGKKKSDVLGQESIANFFNAPAEAKRSQELMHSTEYGGPGILNGLEVAFKGAQGRPLPIRLWGFVLFRGNIEVGSVSFCYNLTEEKRAQESQVVNEKLKSVLEMAGAVLHHLAQPLQVLIGDSSILLEDIPKDDPVRESVEAIADSVKSLKTIMDKIRRLSHTTSTFYTGKTKILDLDTGE